MREANAGRGGGHRYTTLFLPLFDFIFAQQ